ncbi:non-ribosomal peptide synthetase [Embleya scabrispora]|uniref:non-ribosomal peptide synthetase n=1 Tax=Embleya scabrispora TaxID=159449 RepID=UPI00037B6C4B|nr:non-ribosomal peptide synthetase [Embleya scabrispora]MYS81155.1 AMP-binding protein [Streptomyces sp. SID5474]
MGESPADPPPHGDRTADDAATALLDLPMEAARGNGPVLRTRTHVVAIPDDGRSRRPTPAAVLAAYVAVLQRYTGARALVLAVDPAARRDDVGTPDAADESDRTGTGGVVHPAARRIRVTCAPRDTGARLVAEADRRLREAGGIPGSERPARHSAGFRVRRAQAGRAGPSRGADADSGAFGPTGTGAARSGRPGPVRTSDADAGGPGATGTSDADPGRPGPARTSDTDPARPGPARGAAELTLTLVRNPDRDAAHLEITHDADLIDADTAERFGRHVLRMLDGISRRPHTPVADLDLLGPDDHALLRAWGATPDIPDAPRPLGRLLADRAAATPDAVALAYRDEELTYGELDARADALAHRLLASGTTMGAVVGLCMPRCPELVVAMLAVHRAGAAALMLDPKAPDAYLGRFVEQAGARLVVTTNRFERTLPPEAQDVPVLAPAGRVPGPAAPERPLPEPGTDDPAFLVQTSGSTGTPKLVVVTHRGVAHAAMAQIRAHGVSAGERGGWTFPPQTNVSVSVVVWAHLIAGAPLHIAADEDLSTPEHLRDWLLSRGITQVFVVAPLAEALLGIAWPARTPLRTLLTGSDRVRRWAPAELPFEVGNWYGANEVNIVTSPLIPRERPITSHTATARDRTLPPPIGRPWPGARLYVLDRDLRLVPPGVVGELAVSGPEQARGYLTARQTAERFVPDPFADAPGGRLYLTGDLVRFRANGVLEHRGRADHQLKIAGMRVEVGEVEQALLAAEGVRAAAVAAPEDPRGVRRLVAYVVASDGLDTHALRGELARALPDHMVPQLFLRLAALPLNSGDKIDRNALPTPDWGPATDARPDAGEERTAVEEALVRVWEEILYREHLGVHDDFFLLGGESLSAGRAVRLITERLGVVLKVRALMLNPTPAELARELAHPA